MRSRGVRWLLRPRSRRCLELGELDRVVWAEPDALVWAPVDVSSELRDRLWDDGPTAILVSATLTTGEDAGFVRRRLGLEHAREAVVGSPYDFPEQALLYLPRTMPDPRAEEFTDRAADEIVSLLALSEGRALVLTSSYRALEVYRERVRGRVPYEVLVQGEAPRERLLERFREEVGSVLLATSTFWQGVDVPGESLSLLVIDKLPFSAPGDPLHEARCEAVERLGGDWFRDYALPTAMLQLRQGFGRLIRGHSDRGVVAILDPRLRNAAVRTCVPAGAPALSRRRGPRRRGGILRRLFGCFRLNTRARWRTRNPAHHPRRACRHLSDAPARARRAPRPTMSGCATAPFSSGSPGRALSVWSSSSSCSRSAVASPASRRRSAGTWRRRAAPSRPSTRTCRRVSRRTSRA